MKRFWADYTARNFARLDRERLVAVLPVGAVEQHGPHLPLSVDQAILDGLIAAVIPRLAPELPVLFLPTQAVGKSDEHRAWPGTLTLSAGTLIRVWTEIGASVAAAGVRRLMLLNSHGGQMAMMDIVARELRLRHDMLVVGCNWFGLGLPEGEITDHEARHGIHAGDLETSVMRALHPELVEMERARDFVPLTVSLARDFRHLGLGPGGRLAWAAQDMHPAGACGNAAAATAEKGHAILDHVAGELAVLLAEVARAPLAWLDNAPEADG